MEKVLGLLASCFAARLKPLPSTCLPASLKRHAGEGWEWLEGLSPGKRIPAQQSGSGLGGAWRKSLRNTSVAGIQLHSRLEGPEGSLELLGPVLSTLWQGPARLRGCSFGRYLKPPRSVAWDKEGALPLGVVRDGKVSWQSRLLPPCHNIFSPRVGCAHSLEWRRWELAMAGKH